MYNATLKEQCHRILLAGRDFLFNSIGDVLGLINETGGDHNSAELANCLRYLGNDRRVNEIADALAAPTTELAQKAESTLKITINLFEFAAKRDQSCFESSIAEKEVLNKEAGKFLSKVALALLAAFQNCEEAVEKRERFSAILLFAKMLSKSLSRNYKDLAAVIVAESETAPRENDDEDSPNRQF